MTPLRQRMLEEMQVRNLSRHTQRGYLENVARFAGTSAGLQRSWAPRRFAATRCI
jgi:hypothetical protein